ncbi:GNAT family N-acetyltransferase [Pasteurella multocida]|uniref:GNAT family N-acetyltransferase n=1 Tax=Pasteurella multocida TaxID=747 RepID=UPI0002E48DEE|nr:GNAT family N-acetyltransferase [Pasteurella multocida]ARB76454.1 N-acetyltransferase [Pasteurella multocida]NMR51787.1 GNAT family N-acetyltransferase [Pasteurella multocida]NMR61727.1 GNAT family N-acetyltransferase [Pasteurella multocida]OBP30585.1 hypothetical protein A0R67_04155 [Pasteurella multocida subsp. multocida]URK10824.1 GNAT family N-acetyltransferase [Pasteurella multocida]
MINLSKFERNDDIFNQVSEKTKLTKWVNIDPKSPYTEEELLAILENNTLIGYIHIDDVTEFEHPKKFGITKFFIFPEFQNKGYGKKATLELFKKKNSEGYTDVIMQVEQHILPFWENVINSQKYFPKKNIDLIPI